MAGGDGVEGRLRCAGDEYGDGVRHVPCIGGVANPVKTTVMSIATAIKENDFDNCMNASQTYLDALRTCQQPR